MANSYLRDLATFGKRGALSDAQMAAAVAHAFPTDTPKASITRGLQTFKSSKAKQPALRGGGSSPYLQGTLSATRKGTMTQQAAKAIGDLTGHRNFADKLGEASNLVNPLSWATNLGDSARETYEDPTVQHAGNTALEALNFAPVGKAAGALASIGLPLLKKGAKAGEGFFSKAALTRAKSAEGARYVEMSPDEFLSLATPGHRPSSEKAVEEVLDRGEQFTDVPTLNLRYGEGDPKVTRHDGRHRARALKARGVDKMPVLLSGRYEGPAALKAPFADTPIGRIVPQEGGEALPLSQAEDMVRFRHYSHEPNLTEADPSMWLNHPNTQTSFIPREERSRKGKAPPRTYIGLDDGPKPYGRETGVGRHEYTGEVPRSHLYDMDGDPDGLKALGAELPRDQSGRYLYGDRKMDSASLYENLIKDKGYKGYWTDNGQIGRAGALFEPTPLQFKQSFPDKAAVAPRAGDGRTFSDAPRPRLQAPAFAPLEGLPARTNGLPAQGPHGPARLAADEYAKKAGIKYTPPTRYAEVDEDRARRIADAYEQMPHNPTDPEVQKAYGALSAETMAQYEAMKASGVKLGFHPPEGDPYGNPWNAIKDVRENNQLKVYPTDKGYGEAGITPEMEAENPMLKLVDGETWDGQPVRVNDVFRGVHDYFGHAKEGVGFRAAGEENAYRSHAAMFSPEARRAMATETRGQNSWLNYGPKGEANRTASLDGTTFADQKIGLLPDWAVYEGNEDFLKAPLKAPEAPAIIQSRPVAEADWGFEPKFTGLKNRPAPTVGFEPTAALTDRKIITPEDLYGGNIVAAMADRTRAGGILSSLNGKGIAPVELQGGQDFMRQQDAAGTGALWASAGGPMTAITNEVKRLDGPSFLAPFTMGGKSGDYSTMMSDAVLGQLHSTTRKARKAFDAEMRKLKPQWAGMEDLDNLGVLRDQLKKNGGMRVAMAKLMDSKSALASGLPDIGATRQAITDPHLATVPTEAFGNNIGLLSGQKIANPAMPHDTYASQIGGKYTGSMETPIPANLMFPELFNDTVKNGRREDVAYRLKLGVKTQKADQQWLDNIMPWYERERSRGTNWSTQGLPSKSD